MATNPKPASSAPSKIKDGIKQTYDAFLEGLTPKEPAAKNTSIDQDYKKFFLEHAQQVKTFYHYLNDDASSTTKLKKNVLEEMADIIANTKATFEDLDKKYQETLLPALAKNIKAARDLNKGFSTLTNLSRDLAKDIHQSDTLFDELVSSVAEEGQADALKADLKSEVPDTDDPFKMTDKKQAIENLTKLLDDLFLTKFIEINFPAMKENFTAFSTACDELVKDLTDNVKEVDKEEDEALKAYEEAKKAGNSADLEELLKELSNLRDASPASTASTDDKEKEMLDAKNKVKKLETLLSYKEMEEEKVAKHTKRLEKTEALVNELLLNLKNLIDPADGSMTRAVTLSSQAPALANAGGSLDAAKDLAILDVFNYLQSIGKFFLKELEALGLIEGIINTLNAKFGDQDTQSDVKVYVNRLSTELGELEGPSKDFTQKLLENSQMLHDLHGGLSQLFNEYFEKLGGSVTDSSLQDAADKKGGVIDALTKKKDNAEYDKTAGKLKSEIEAAKIRLNKKIQEYNLQKNKADFESKIKAA